MEDTLKQDFLKVQRRCQGFEICVNNEAKYHTEAFETLQKLVKGIQTCNIFSPNEEISDIDPQHLPYLLIPYYQADTLFRFMEDRKTKVALAKDFYIQFLLLMDHYELLDEQQKKALEKATSPDESDKPQLPPQMDREAKIAALKEKKLLEIKIAKYKDSEDIGEVRELQLALIKTAIMNSFDGMGTVNLELQLLQFRDTLPAEERHVKSEAPKEKKPIEMFHIPKGALNDQQHYMFGDGASGQGQAQPQAPGAPGVVQTFQETGKRIEKVEVTTANAANRMDVRDNLAKQVFQPGWHQPTMSLEEFADNELAEAQEREAHQAHQAHMEEQKDPESEEVLEAERQKNIQWDLYADEVPKGYGNTKRL